MTKPSTHSGLRRARWRAIARDAEVATVLAIVVFGASALFVLWRLWALTTAALSHFLGAF